MLSKQQAKDELIQATLEAFRSGIHPTMVVQLVAHEAKAELREEEWPATATRGEAD